MGGIGLVVGIVLLIVMSIAVRFRRSAPQSKKEHPLMQVAREQARLLERREADGVTLEEWLEWAVDRLCWWWPDVTRSWARRNLLDHMPAEFGNPNCAWTKDSAEEMADDFVKEYGEQGGSNQ